MFGRSTVPDTAAEARFLEMLVHCAKAESHTPIATRFPWQARLVNHVLLQNAIQRAWKREKPILRLLTGSLAEPVYNAQFHADLLEFVKKGGQARLLVWDIPNDDSLRFEKPIDVRYSNTRASGERLHHFLVVGNAYRYEARHEYFTCRDIEDDKPVVPARVCFHDPRSAEALVAGFDSLWSESYDVAALVET